MEKTNVFKAYKAYRADKSLVMVKGSIDEVLKGRKPFVYCCSNKENKSRKSFIGCIRELGRGDTIERVSFYLP